MRQWLTWLNMFLEFIWNKTVVLQYPIRYKMCAIGTNRVVTQWIKVGDQNRKFIFVSQQISYLRIGGWLKKKARLYRVEVIEELDDDVGLYPSKVYLIPELCWSIFKYTLAPHSCAINFIIHSLESEG